MAYIKTFMFIVACISGNKILIPNSRKFLMTAKAYKANNKTLKKNSLHKEDFVVQPKTKILR